MYENSVIKEIPAERYYNSKQWLQHQERIHKHLI